ncbi:sigma factor-like helix-turn-helix DNA-binding protein [Lysinibacillus sp. KU-BSD001]|uniref:sigma factor-like helix-turn-helix DNA-binding protein n=1 Tax=Lysinibacillus sp. KU-BSD001 TaxID=3141328 RepID=UPI0036EEA913
MGWRQQLINEYKKTRKYTRQLLNECAEEDRKVINGMIQELTYAIQYLKCGYDPLDHNAGIHQKEQQGGYDKRRILFEDGIEQFGKPDRMRIFGELPDCERQLTSEQKQLITESLKGLTKKQIDCYLLHVCHSRTYEEIAVELSIGQSTVQTHIERAKEKISSRVKALDAS